MRRIERPCVYTILFGAYEALNEQPVAIGSDIPFICLTDDPHLKSETWTVVQVTPAFSMDPIRSQRILKICPHEVEALQDYDGSLYIDNTVLLKAQPEELWESLPWSSGLGLPLHSFRDSVHDEFIEVAKLGFDDQGRIFEQLNHYLATEAEILDERPYWTAIMLRDHRDAQVQAAMSLWRNHVLRYSRRDQLSLNAVLHSLRFRPDTWSIDDFESWFHKWPAARRRDTFAGPRAPIRSATPVATELAETRAALNEMRRELRIAQMQCDSAQREAEQFARSAVARNALLTASEQTRASLEAQIHELKQQCSSWEEKATLALREIESVTQSFRKSTSWRITAPLRKLHRLRR